MSPSAPVNCECVLVTGASSGLGAEFARQLAPISQRMVLVARREEQMLALENELRESNPALEVGSLSVNLSKSQERDELITRLTSTGWNPTLLVNSAGMGDYGEVASSDWEKISSIIEVNVTALTHLVHGFLPHMLRERQGAIVNVSSLASLLPIPDFAVYAASKAYVTSFSEALRMELREEGIPVLAVCPGPVKTGFGEVARRSEGEEGMAARELFYVEKKQVVTESLSALMQDRARVYPGWKIALLATGISLLPMAAIRVIMSRRPRRIAHDQV